MNSSRSSGQVSSDSYTLRHRGAVLADEAGAGRDGAIHADALFVGAVPLSPAVAFRGFDRDAVMIADDIGERLQTERAGVILVGAPGAELHAVDRLDDLRIAAERQPGPFVGDLRRR